MVAHVLRKLTKRQYSLEQVRVVAQVLREVATGSVQLFGQSVGCRGPSQEEGGGITVVQTLHVIHIGHLVVASHKRWTDKDQSISGYKAYFRLLFRFPKRKPRVEEWIPGMSVLEAQRTHN